MAPNNPKIVIVGSGWAASTLLNNLNLKLADIFVISPDTTTSHTPLLASAATGLFGFRVTEQPVRSRLRQGIRFYKAKVTSVDFRDKCITCAAAFEEQAKEEDKIFKVDYDYLVLSPGCQAQTFGIEGVEENAVMVRTAEDARVLRQKIVDVLEKAALPTTSPMERRQLLHFAIVGGGPTDVEVAAELSDLVHDDLRQIYPFQASEFSITIYDVASQILGMFDKHLADYAHASFEKRGVHIATDSMITKVIPNVLTTRGDDDIPFGLLIWATGNASVPLLEQLACSKSSYGKARILTNAQLQVLDPHGEAIIDAFALGDAAEIVGQPLPETAEVAVQKRRYLAVYLNNIRKVTQQGPKPFMWSERRMVAYLGGFDGIWRHKYTERQGYIAWLSWRYTGLYWAWASSWRLKILIIVNWCLNLLFGRKIGR